MYGLNGRDYHEEMEKRYNKLVNVMADLLDCGSWDIEELIVGDIIKMVMLYQQIIIINI